MADDLFHGLLLALFWGLIIAIVLKLAGVAP